LASGPEGKGRQGGIFKALKYYDSMRFFREFTLSQWQRFFTEFTLSLKIRPFVSLRVTGGEGFRMTGEGFRMTSMAFPSLQHSLPGEG
jgi:hypothetical protein